MSSIKIGDRLVGPGERTFIIAEIGINHNGSLALAKELIDGAAKAGCDAVKFQKRTPELAVPPDFDGAFSHEEQEGAIRLDGKAADDFSLVALLMPA